MSGPAQHRFRPVALAVTASLVLAALLVPLGASAAPKPKTLRGNLTLVHQDSAPGGYRYYLEQHGRMSEELLFPQPPGLRPNTPVQVSGVERGNALQVSSTQKLGQAPAAPTTTGAKKLLVILVDWGAGLSTDQSTANDFAFSTTDARRRSITQWYTDVSYGQIAWSGQVTSILTIADPGSCVLNTIANRADTAAANAGFTLANFDNKMYVFPDPGDCASAGWGQIANKRSWIVDGLWNIDDGYARMIPDHELGHNLGEYHGHGLECGADTITNACVTGAQGNFCEDGVGAPCVSEYGNAYDVMGNNWTSNDYDAVNWFGLWHQRRFGWVNGRVTTDPQPGAAADHTFDIGPIEASTGNAGLVLTTAAGATFVVEYRQPLSQDAYLTNFPDATSGVHISRNSPVVGADAGPVSLDTSPDSSLSPFCNDLTEYCDWFDAALNVGATYTDPSGAFSLTLNSSNASGANVTVHWAGGGSGGGTSVGEMDPAVAYNGWAGAADAGASGGTYRVSTVKPEKVVWKSPTATSVTWSTLKGPDRGIAKVVIDGVNKGNVDLHAASPAAANVVFGGLASQVHNVVISVTGLKNAASSGFGVPVDALAAGATTNQDDNVKLTYQVWKGASNTAAQGGAYRFATASTARATFAFTGTGVDWITAKGKAYGKAEVIIDGVNEGTFDLYATANAWKTAIPFTGLSAGSHTMVVHVLGTKNASATSTKVVVDGFTVHA